MNNRLSADFRFFSLLRFAAPSIIMMIITALYSIVDSIFVSRFVGTNALSSINIVYPVINIVYGLGVMLASGGSAIVAAKMGAGKEAEGRQNFTMLVLVAIVLGAMITTLGLCFLDPIVRALGASDLLLGYGRDYLRVILCFAPACMLQMVFQMFFVTAGKPGFGLFFSICAGLVNATLDYVFIVPLQMGIGGAALATGIGYLTPAVAGIFFFFHKNKPLHFTRPRFSMAVLLESCANGSSEMVSNISMALVTFVFNFIMMRYLGENGVAAITIVMYAQFLMSSVFMGFSLGVQPVISYHYGARNQKTLRHIMGNSLIFITLAAGVIFAAAMLLGPTIVQVFTPVTSPVYRIAVQGFRLLPFCFLFEGFSIFASAGFTALSNGRVSAIISFLRTFVFIVAGLLLLPALLGEIGIWLSIPVAELLALAVSAFFALRCRKQYGI